MPPPLKLAHLLDSWIRSPHHTNLTPQQKLDVLDRAVDWMRHELGHGRNKLGMNLFLSGVVGAEEGRLIFDPSLRKRSELIWTPPLQLQPHLLLYLLLYHREGAAPLEVMDGFIAKMLPQLSSADFVRTATGVTRCYTNTRLAANTLRNYGFLRYTHKERYKAWVLTLPGIVVAAHLLKNDGWKIQDYRREAKKDLHKGIYASLEVTDDYEDFVSFLEYLLRDDCGVFETFKPALRRAYEILNKFRYSAEDTCFQYAYRHKICRELIDELDRWLEHSIGPNFYEQFSAAMNIEALIKAVDEKYAK
jgi:hypothetical protein